MEVLDAVLRFLSRLDLRVLAFACLAVAGACLMTSGLGLLPLIRLPGRRVDLDTDVERMRGDVREGLALFEGAPFFERALGPVMQGLIDALPKDDLAWVENALDLLDHPSYLKRSSDYYAAQVLFALAGFLVGVVLGVWAMANGASAWAFSLPLMLGVFGYLLPKQDVQRQLATRRVAMLFEAPFLFDRLAANYLAKQSLIQALIHLTSTPDGGFLMRELRQVAEDYLKKVGSTQFSAALARMAERNADVPIIQRFCERLILTEDEGAQLLSALNVMGERARALVENRVRQCGAENQALLIVPTLIALAGIMAIIGAPMLALINRAF
jgi:hypothetical protein